MPFCMKMAEKNINKSENNVLIDKTVSDKGTIYDAAYFESNENVPEVGKGKEFVTVLIKINSPDYITKVGELCAEASSYEGIEAKITESELILGLEKLQKGSKMPGLNLPDEYREKGGIINVAKVQFPLENNFNYIQKYLKGRADLSRHLNSLKDGESVLTISDVSAKYIELVSDYISTLNHSEEEINTPVSISKGDFIDGLNKTLEDKLREN